MQASNASDGEGNPVNPLDAQFNSLSLNKMDPVERDSDEFKMLARYMSDTHGKTHGHIKAKLKNVYRVERYAKLSCSNRTKLDETLNAGALKLKLGRMLATTPSRTRKECYSGMGPERPTLLVSCRKVSELLLRKVSDF